MAKDWKKIARANALPIADKDLARITPALDSLETSFRPLVEGLRQDLGSALIFRAAVEDSE